MNNSLYDTISAIIGGTIAGIGMFAVLVIPFLYFSRKKSSHKIPTINIPDGAYSQDKAYEFATKHISFALSRYDFDKYSEAAANGNDSYRSLSKQLQPMGVNLTSKQMTELYEAETLYLMSIADKPIDK